MSFCPDWLRLLGNWESFYILIFRFLLKVFFFFLQLWDDFIYFFFILKIVIFDFLCWLSSCNFFIFGLHFISQLSSFDFLTLHFLKIFISLFLFPFLKQSQKLLVSSQSIGRSAFLKVLSLMKNKFSRRIQTNLISNFDSRLEWRRAFSYSFLRLAEIIRSRAKHHSFVVSNSSSSLVSIIK